MASTESVEGRAGFGSLSEKREGVRRMFVGCDWPGGWMCVSELRVAASVSDGVCVAAAIGGRAADGSAGRGWRWHVVEAFGCRSGLRLPLAPARSSVCLLGPVVTASPFALMLIHSCWLRGLTREIVACFNSVDVHSRVE